MTEKLRKRILEDIYENHSRTYMRCLDFFYDKKNINRMIPHYHYPNMILRHTREEKRINYYCLPKIKIDLRKDKIIATQPTLVKEELRKYLEFRKKKINKLTVMTYKGKKYLLDGHHRYVYLKYFKQNKTAIARHLNLDIID